MRAALDPSPELLPCVLQRSTDIKKTPQKISVMIATQSASNAKELLDLSRVSHHLQEIGMTNYDLVTGADCGGGDFMGSPSLQQANVQSTLYLG